MSGSINPIILLNQEGKVAERMRMLGFNTIIHPFFYLWERPKRLKTLLHHPNRSTYYRFLTVNRKCVRDTIADLKGTHVDMVHSNTSITTVGVPLAKKLGAKHVWHIREFLDLDFGISVYGGRDRLRRMINTADVRICVSKAVSSHWHFVPENTHVLWDAVGFDDHPECHFGLKERFFLFCAANVTRQKGAIEAVEAFCLSKLSLEGYCLKIVGHCEDSFRNELLSIAAQHGEGGNIVFYDYTNQIHEFFSRATAFLMCSQCEALGRVSVQAMYNHSLVIAKNAGGTTDFIRNKETGLLYDTVDECASLMRFAANNDLSGITDRACLFVKENFSFEHYRTELSRIYQSIC